MITDCTIELPSFPGQLLPEYDRIAVAMGVFDGVHLGHQAIIRNLVEVSRETDAVPVALFFEPHPRHVLMHVKPELLTKVQEKVALLREFGAQKVICFPFTSELSRLSPEEFLKKYFFVEGLSVTGFCVGSNWRFGHGNGGDASYLKQWCNEHGMKSRIVSSICHDGQVISSTRIRQAVSDGDLRLAHHMLGRPYAISGIVEGGLKIGSTALDCPTANIRDSEYVMPKFGVYAARTNWIESGSVHRSDGIVYVGDAPTIRGGGVPEVIVELHLLDFHGDLYGRKIQVEFLDYMRPSIRFESAEALSIQIKKDIANCRIILKRYE